MEYIFFVGLCKFGSFKNPFAMIKILSELYFRIRRFGTNEKIDFYEQWQQHKLLKTMEISKTWPDIFYEGYMHQFEPEPTHKIH